MPKRIVDGDAIATSKTLRKVPEKFRLHYPYLLTLAFANGVFEYAPDAIWASRYSLLMPSITVEKVTEILLLFEDSGLLFKYVANGKLYGYWIKSDVPGRLPPLSRIGLHEKTGPPPPAAELACYMESHGWPVASQRNPGENETSQSPKTDHGQPVASQTHPQENNHGQPVASRRLPVAPLGLGLGGGEGSSEGSGEGKEKIATPNGVAEPDPRHEPIRKAIKALQKAIAGQEVWDGSAASTLDKLLRSQPKFPLNLLLRGVVNRFASEGRSPSEHPRRWIPSLMDYTFSPLDRFKKIYRGVDTRDFWKVVDPGRVDERKSEIDEAECAHHADFVRGLGAKAPPDEKRWLAHWQEYLTKREPPDATDRKANP